MLGELLIDTFRPYNFRGKLRLIDPFVPREGERVASVFGSEVSLDLRDSIQRWIYMGAFEPKETALVRSWLRPGMTFLDVGANVGYFTLLAAERVGPAGAVHAVEPSPYAFARLEAAVRANGLGHVSAHQLGLSAAAGELTLYVQPETDGFHSPTMSASSGGEPVLVRVDRLDDCLDRWRVAEVDLLKIDVEGHEPQALLGGSRTLEQGRVGAVLCEFNEHWLRSQGGSSDELYTLLLDLGFVDQQPTPEFGPQSFETRFLIHRSYRRNRANLT